ncbi:ABC efflux pump, inner membrane subunit [Candidatus Koribacter versatilis Ellin345]|uniref:ABC efflux pump, inner membrane subunit n=1 Tax=Koribacter versatilis (strain Ellin345) TaxID=204669 RepID=Q1IIC4_KORVE|nr:ABC transporter permease [Candidatus Koribacter versatilis]ABF43376.1 ABC efflux pump, inner membrane subunit [Candidatus Koribacter versatilis Ellin345]
MATPTIASNAQPHVTLGARWKRFGFGENARMAFDTLRNHKMRSFLTVLGVVIGVAAQIFVASILVGFDSSMREMLESFGANTLFIQRFNPGIHTGRLSAEERQRKVLTLEDGEAIKELCPSVAEVDVEIFQDWWSNPRNITARSGGHEVFSIDHSGTLPTYEVVHNAPTQEGRWFTDAENEHRADVVVIGAGIEDALFPGHDAIGKNILIDGINYTIVGVLEKRKQYLISDDSQDKIAKVPYRTYQKHHPQDHEGFIAAMAFPGKMAQAQDEVTNVLRVRRRVPPNQPNNFGIDSADAIADQFRQIMSMTFLMTIVVSSIGLLVGGVGVMNIMLMSVTERTHEIGVRKAIGAKKGDIIRQFLTEAIVLTGAGGVVGVIFGMLGAKGISMIFTTLSTSVPLWAVISGVAVAMSVGLFFGMYPAVKAARLDPVEALRYE